MKKSSSYDALSSPQQDREETGVVVNPYYPHPLPFKPRPVPPPRRKKLLNKAHSSLYLSSDDVSVDTLSQPRLQLTSRDRPVPLPRRTLQSQSLPLSPSYAAAEHTPAQEQKKTTARTYEGGNRYGSSLVTLGKLAQNPHYLPATIETIDGFYGFGHKCTFSTGERFFVHFIKHVKMVVLCDCMRLQFYVPLGSAIKFALACEREDEFLKVSDMMGQGARLPHAICSKQCIPRKGKQDAIEEGEILILQHPSTHRSRLGIPCTSLRTDKVFVLSKDCKGVFTTAPEKTCMYLLDMVKHLSHLFPCRVHLYPPASCTEHEQFTHGRTFTLKEYTTVTSLVVRNAKSPDTQFFDIVLDEDLSKLRVCLLKVQQTANGPYDVPRPHLYASLLKSDFASGFQNSLYVTVRHDAMTEGTELMNSMTAVPGGDRTYDYIQIGPRSHYSYMENSPRPTAKSPAEENRDYLKSLTAHEVLCLLDAMGLARYKTKFSEEKVTGSFLAECSMHHLQSYLSIHSQLHCLRLQQIISGKKSAQALLSEFQS